jgi:hypothetical protein
MTERVNRNIKTMLRAYLDQESHSSWAKNIPFFAMSLNSSNHESTGFTPAKLLLNRELNLPVDLSTSLSEHELKLLAKSVPQSQRDIILSRREDYNKMLEFVSSSLQVAAEKQKKYYDERHDDVEFQIGDKVVIRDTTLSDKAAGVVAGLRPLFRPNIGVVSEKYSPLNYEVQFDDGSKKGPLHIQFMRKYRERDEVGDDVTPPVSNNHNNNTDDDVISSPVAPLPQDEPEDVVVNNHDFNVDDSLVINPFVDFIVPHSNDVSVDDVRLDSVPDPSSPPPHLDSDTAPAPYVRRSNRLKHLPQKDYAVVAGVKRRKRRNK